MYSCVPDSDAGDVAVEAVGQDALGLLGVGGVRPHQPVERARGVEHQRPQLARARRSARRIGSLRQAARHAERVGQPLAPGRSSPRRPGGPAAAASQPQRRGRGRLADAAGPAADHAPAAPSRCSRQGRSRRRPPVGQPVDGVGVEHRTGHERQHAAAAAPARRRAGPVRRRAAHVGRCGTRRRRASASPPAPPRPVSSGADVDGVHDHRARGARRRVPAARSRSRPPRSPGVVSGSVTSTTWQRVGSASIAATSVAWVWIGPPRTVPAGSSRPAGT